MCSIAERLVLRSAATAKPSVIATKNHFATSVLDLQIPLHVQRSIQARGNLHRIAVSRTARTCIAIRRGSSQPRIAERNLRVAPIAKWLVLRSPAPANRRTRIREYCLPILGINLNLPAKIERAIRRNPNQSRGSPLHHSSPTFWRTIHPKPRSADLTSTPFPRHPRAVLLRAFCHLAKYPNLPISCASRKPYKRFKMFWLETLRGAGGAPLLAPVGVRIALSHPSTVLGISSAC